MDQGQAVCGGGGALLIVVCLGGGCSREALLQWLSGHTGSITEGTGGPAMLQGS